MKKVFDLPEPVGPNMTKWRSHWLAGRKTSRPRKAFARGSAFAGNGSPLIRFISPQRIKSEAFAHLAEPWAVLMRRTRYAHISEYASTNEPATHINAIAQKTKVISP